MSTLQRLWHIRYHGLSDWICWIEFSNNSSVWPNAWDASPIPDLETSRSVVFSFSGCCCSLCAVWIWHWTVDHNDIFARLIFRLILACSGDTLYFWSCCTHQSDIGGLLPPRPSTLLYHYIRYSMPGYDVWVQLALLNLILCMISPFGSLLLPWVLLSCSLYACYWHCSSHFDSSLYIPPFWTFLQVCTHIYWQRLSSISISTPLPRLAFLYCISQSIPPTLACSSASMSSTHPNLALINPHHHFFTCVGTFQLYTALYYPCLALLCMYEHFSTLIGAPQFLSALLGLDLHGCNLLQTSHPPN